MEYGSHFIRCLVYVFSRKAHVDHVIDMLIEVYAHLILYWYLFDRTCYKSLLLPNAIFMPSPTCIGDGGKGILCLC